MLAREGEQALHQCGGTLAALARIREPSADAVRAVEAAQREIQTIERAKRRVELDRYYIDHWSLGLDPRIMIETVVNLAFDKNAY